MIRVVLLAGDLGWHRALARRLAGVDGAEVVGVVVQSKPRADAGRRWRLLRAKPAAFARRLGVRALSGGLYREIDDGAARRFGDGGWPDVPRLDTPTVNSAEVGAFVEGLRPDLVCVSGTAIVRAPVIDMAPPLGMLNLHTGISPYYKGGPNCTLWCLANHEPWAIGSTIHVLDPGIDSGALVRTDRVAVAADATAASLAVDAMALGHDLYAETLTRYAQDGRPAPVPQSALGEGRTYYTREWTGLRARAARRYVASGQLRDWVEAGRPAPDAFRLVDAFE